MTPIGITTPTFTLSFRRGLRGNAGPIASMLLGDLGAEIWKLEPPGGDETRGWGPPFWGDPAEGRSAYFASVNRNKRSLVVDLTTDAGRALTRRSA